MLKTNNRYKLIIFDSGKRIVLATNNKSTIENNIRWANGNALTDTRVYIYDFVSRQKWKFQNFKWYSSLFGSMKWAKNTYLEKM